MTGGPSRPAPGEVHVWAIDLDDAAPGSGGLDVEEREWAARLCSAEHRRRYTACHRVLRTLLAAYAERDAGTVQYGFGARGKPRLACAPGQPDVRFNLAHAGPHALVAIARGREVGVDIEHLRPWADLAPLLSVACARAERRIVENARGFLRAGLFTQLWVRKEAILKAEGVGLSRSPREIEVLSSAGAPAFATTWGRPSTSKWTLQAVPTRRSCRAALAVEGSATLVLREWPQSAPPHVARPETEAADT